MTDAEFNLMTSQKVESRQREAVLQAAEMRRTGELADDYEAANWINAQHDRISANPWG